MKCLTIKKNLSDEVFNGSSLCCKQRRQHNETRKCSVWWKIEAKKRWRVEHPTYCPIITSYPTSQNTKNRFNIPKKRKRLESPNLTTAIPTLTIYLGASTSYYKLLMNSKLLFMHSVGYNCCPGSFKNVWNTNGDPSTNHNLKNSNTVNFDVPPTAEIFLKKFPLSFLPKFGISLMKQAYVATKHL